MEKVYHEMDTRPTGESPNIRTYIEVQAYIPKGEEQTELPAVIVLAQGSINLATRSPDDIEYATMPWDHKASEVIREAIRLFDLLRLKVWEKVDGE